MILLGRANSSNAYHQILMLGTEKPTYRPNRMSGFDTGNALSRKRKTGRNEPCPCGSGLKYKRCHGGLTVDSPAHVSPAQEAQVKQILAEEEARRVQRERQQGLGRPIISCVHKGYRFVAVGSRLYYSKTWQTFHDFLRYYLPSVLGSNWFNSEKEKPAEERHAIVRWAEQAITDAKRLGEERGGMLSAPMTGAIRAYVNLAYNIYLIDHHVDQRKDELLARLLNRLKDHQAFQGALYETYVAAAFLKAGFRLDFEDDANAADTHGEFIATHSGTGNCFWVEAKARDRKAADDNPLDEVRRLGIGNKLYKALAKKTDLPRVVFIDVNVPDLVSGDEPAGWMSAALDQIMGKERSLTIKGEPAPSAYVFVTNHPYHLNLMEKDSNYSFIAEGFKIPDFGASASFTQIKDLLASRERHREMMDLVESLRTHYEIPATFDGESPELAFGSRENVPRLKIGNWYAIPDNQGNEVQGQLYEAIVVESWRACVGAYRTRDGQNLIAKCPVNDAEIAAYNKNPDTFFGVYRPENRMRKIKTVVDAFDFLYETYKRTPKERLLEFLAESPDIDDLRQLPQEDLAIAYCERIAHSMVSRGAEASAEEVKPVEDAST